MKTKAEEVLDRMLDRIRCEGCGAIVTGHYAYPPPRCRACVEKQRKTEAHYLYRNAGDTGGREGMKRRSKQARTKSRKAREPKRRARTIHRVMRRLQNKSPVEWLRYGSYSPLP